jgi:type II secretory pathway pseudopilin PulG
MSAIEKLSNWEIENRWFSNYSITKFSNYSILAMSFPSQTRGIAQRRERGYIMLTLLLAIAMMAIFAAAIAPTIAFDIKRDREEEMIHRGVQYSRAIRAYYKKFGRYPVKLEDLEGTNNLRFLRKRYKDPLNCKNSKCADFKLLHFGEVQMTLSGISGGTIPGASPIGGNGGTNGGTNGPGGFSQSSTFGGSSGFGANSNSSFGQNQPTAGNLPAGSDPSQAGSSTGSGDQSGQGSGTNSSGPNGSGPGGNGGSNQLGSGQVIGGPIVGVASNTPIKDSTIREFNHKKKYKDWVFVYDPAQDQGFLIKTPYQPQLQASGQGTPNLNGQSGSSNTGSAFGTSSGFGNNNGSSFGNSSSFGTSSSGMGNGSNSPASGGFGQPSAPSNPPQQQQ